VIQIRGVVAGYERTVIANRMRRGRLTALRAGRLLLWTTPPYGFHVDPRMPREPVRALFGWYTGEGLTIYQIAQRLTSQGIATARGHAIWTPLPYAASSATPATAALPTATGCRTSRPRGGIRSSVARPKGQAVRPCNSGRRRSGLAYRYRQVCRPSYVRRCSPSRAEPHPGPAHYAARLNQSQSENPT
jgi:site-specific DNA recombinase